MCIRDRDKYDHPTQKPVDLMRRPILNHLKRGGMVYDPFLGSGTTLAAAELTERVCLGIELDPKYVDVIIPVSYTHLIYTKLRDALLTHPTLMEGLIPPYLLPRRPWWHERPTREPHPERGAILGDQ